MNHNTFLEAVMFVCATYGFIRLILNDIPHALASFSIKIYSAYRENKQKRRMKTWARIPDTGGYLEQELEASRILAKGMKGFFERNMK